MWKHTASGWKLPGLYVYIASAIFVSTFVLQALILLYRNITFRNGHARALISKQRGTVRMSIDVPRPLNVQAGQYVNVWMPSISFWSFLQSHPFTIASWDTRGNNTTLDLMIVPRRGFTRELYTSAEESLESIPEQSTAAEARSTRSSEYDKHFQLELNGRQIGADDGSYQDTLEEGASQPKFGYKNASGDPQRSDFRLVLFSGPHGRGISVGDYGKVLMIATDSGIVAQLPYLQELVSGFNNYRVRTRDIHLVWELHCIGIPEP